VNEGPRYVSFRDYLRVARERRWLILAVAALFTGLAFLYVSRQTPSYSAEALVLFESPNTQASLLGVGQDVGGQTPEQRAAAAAEIVVRPSVLARASKRLNGTPKGVIAASVTARPEAKTNLVVIQGRWDDGVTAAGIANAVAIAARDVANQDARKRFARAAAAQRRVLSKLPKDAQFQRAITSQQIAKLDELASRARPVSIQRQATAPSHPASPRKVATTLLGLLVGLTLGLIAAFARDAVDRRFKSKSEIAEELRLPMLGFVPEAVLGCSVVETKRRRAFTDLDLEGFRILRTNVEFLDVDDPPKLVVVTSALPEEGKSTVSAALAATYSAAGKRTLMVECDLRRPTLAGTLGIAETPGLTDYLVGHADPGDVIQTIGLPTISPDVGTGPEANGTGVASLVAITAGTPAPQPAELLRSKRCQAFFEQVKQVYDIVIVDCPPLLPVADTLEIVPVSDAIVICLRASKTTREQARAAKAALAHLPERAAGVVVTGLRSAEEAVQYGYYAYGEAYRPSRSKTRA
jgi:Mrp family chromosome partitioning ATPase